MSENNIDALLVQQVLEGDKEAFGVLVMKYQTRIAHAVQKIISDKASVMDIVQESFYKAYKALNNFRSDSSFYTWLYRIAVNTAKNHTISRSRRPPDVDVDFADAEALFGKHKLRSTDGPEGMLLRDELQEQVLAALNELPEDLRQALVLREIGGLSYDDIAVIMQCPIGTVRSRIFRARVALDEVIKPFMRQ